MADNDNGNTDGKGKVIQTALGPAAMEFAEASKGAGKDLGEVAALSAKSVRVLLSPLSLLIWSYDQIKEKFIPTVERKLEGVPEDRRIEPTLLIAGPTVEALRFAGEIPELQEMFANLLATAIDAETAQYGHPAFVEIIKQLSPDEARILKYMANDDAVPLLNLRITQEGRAGSQLEVRNFSLLASQADLEHSNLVPQNIDNLCRLGLCEIPPLTLLATPGVYDPLETHPEVKQFLEEKNALDRGGTKIERLYLRLTSLGGQFVAACVVSRDALLSPPKSE